MSDADKLTQDLIKAGANRAKVIAIIDGYGDAVDWSRHSLDSIIAEVWQSDINSGDDPDHWIINEICLAFNLSEVTDDTCYQCDAPCSSISEYQDDGRVFCSLDCLNKLADKEQ